MDAPRLSLAQQIAQLDEAAPIDIDPEDVYAYDAEGQDKLGVDPAAREHYIDVGPSAIRKLHDSLSDPKYNGVKTTRKQLMEESEDEISSEEGSEEDQESEAREIDERSDATSPGGSEREIHPPESDDERPEPSTEAVTKRAVASPESVEDSSLALRIKRDEDRKKGKAVSRQIAIWDSLLDARICFQKTVTAANKLPAMSELQSYSALPECREAMDKMLAEAAALSDELFELQEHLLISNESIKPPPRKRRKINSGDSLSAYETFFEEATVSVSALEATYHPYLVQTLSKWSSKIQAVAPSILLPSNRNSFASKGPQHLKSVTKLIDETLDDSEKLRARTRIRRTKGNRIGTLEEAVDTEDPSIFDDTDFYQQLLRDVIDARGNTNGGDEDWMVAQKQKKSKKKVDTKASKGRKIRYEVHEKLQNFMVPVPVVGAWHEEQIDELFASLLGRGFGTTVTVNDKEEAEKGHGEQLGEVIKDGFRVFG